MSSLKTILVLSNNLGGLYSFRKEVIQAMVDEGYHVVISVPDADNPKGKYIKKMGCIIIATSFNRTGVNPFSDIKLMVNYIKLIRQHCPLAVLTYTIKPNVYGGMACRLCGVAQMANITGLGDALENKGWLQKLSVILYKIGIRKSQRVFFQNSNNRETCIHLGITSEESILLPGSGVNLRHHALQPYPENKGEVKFLFIGRMKHDKGIEEYFAAAQTIKSKYPNTEFQILGYVEENYQKELGILVEQGIINFLGSSTDVRPYIAAVHCTIMPSYHEGMSNVNLESAAAGRPIITTNVPGCRETVDDGKNGYLVEARSARSLIEAVERFISLPYNEKERMGQLGRKKVESEFNRQIVVDAYLKELNSITNV